MAATATFEELIARARNGDSDAVTAIITQYEPEVRIVARLRLSPALRPYLDSMDLVQSVHRSLIRGLQDQRFAIEKPEQLVALASTMIRRKAARVWRRQKRQQRPGDAASGIGELLNNLASPGTDPTSDATMKDAVARLERDLDPLDKQLLEMNLLGYRTAEIARLLKRDPDVLRVRLSRLRAKLIASGVTADWTD